MEGVSGSTPTLRGEERVGVHFAMRWPWSRISMIWWKIPGEVEECSFQSCPAIDFPYRNNFEKDCCGDVSLRLRILDHWPCVAEVYGWRYFLGLIMDFLLVQDFCSLNDQIYLIQLNDVVPPIHGT